jgi:hypothetical protein
MNIEELWTAACSGDLTTLRNYYSGVCEINRRYHKFGSDHSLIAGAYRNNQMEAVDFLLDMGETILDHERTELKEIYYRAVVLAATRLVNYTKNINYNLSETQKGYIGDLAVALYELNKEG